MPTPLKIPSFTPLSPCTFIYIPPSTAKPTPQTITAPPPLILLCTYLNASTAHINKYTSFYKRLFPTSRILLVTTSSEHFLFRSSKSWTTDLDPAVTALLALSGQGQGQDQRVGTEKEGQKILLHVISTGGATAAMKIAEAYKARSGTRLPIAKMVLDSCPGVQGWGSTVGAFSVGLATSRDGGLGGWDWVLGRVKALVMGVALRVFFGVWFLIELVMSIENVVGVVRRRLNDKTLFRDDATRLYIYGGRDELVRAQDVEGHADEAEKSGYEVLRVRYGDSGHAGHLLQDEGRFRASVLHLWDSGVLSGPGMIVCAW
ncbi:uncharacterized protein LDX57_005486 [Aspergillus melleus]|uniref:uncharacterized protein n=1 Tax=Aspergillus melleus TaxID=138277 RepID=UPI001E8E83A0|nr:uncharacterized protein LDX57_005486 [Aspergillus melleus]KAH8427780.1 hypothetical protein LDX57_005486 [Aspergillus melleus]